MLQSLIVWVGCFELFDVSPCDEILLRVLVWFCMFGYWFRLGYQAFDRLIFLVQGLTQVGMVMLKLEGLE